MAECSSEDLARALTDRPNFTCSSRGEAIGLTVTVEGGLLSLVTILFVLWIIVRTVRWRRRHFPTAPSRIFQYPMDILIASLLLANVVQAIGAVMSLKWVLAGKAEVGPFCTAQGVIKIFGATGIAFSTSTIAVYTFLEVWVMKNIKSMKLTLGVVVTFWSFIAALVTMALMLNRTENFSFMGPTPWWCWINKYQVGFGWKIALEYLWLWLMFIISFLVYISLYLWMRGNLVVDNHAWWKFYFKSGTDENQETLIIRRRSLVMLAYPAVDCICILPLSIIRWKSYTQGQAVVSPAASFAAASLLCGSLPLRTQWIF